MTMTIALDPYQVGAVRSALAAEVSEARAEARRTDNPSYKRELRARTDALVGALGRLVRDHVLDLEHVDVVVGIVRADLAQLGVEIRHTDSWEYKAQLKVEAEVLRSVLAVVRSVAMHPAGATHRMVVAAPVVGLAV